mmetsp:Transcript_103580/g.198825  ORF Transcript_103580/g.198825 Transcript_103580/m.198825 type:complete len:210 (+) Transcript_103580:1051-1680(+)
MQQHWLESCRAQAPVAHSLPLPSWLVPKSWVLTWSKSFLTSLDLQPSLLEASLSWIREHLSGCGSPASVAHHCQPLKLGLTANPPWMQLAILGRRPELLLMSCSRKGRVCGQCLHYGDASGELLGRGRRTEESWSAWLVLVLDQALLARMDLTACTLGWRACCQSLGSACCCRSGQMRSGKISDPLFCGCATHSSPSLQLWRASPSPSM